VKRKYEKLDAFGMVWKRPIGDGPWRTTGGWSMNIIESTRPPVQVVVWKAYKFSSTHAAAFGMTRDDALRRMGSLIIKIEQFTGRSRP
jgi:hypothetical protein